MGRTAIVEFVGIPGAGKSTLAQALAADLSGDLDVAFPQRGEYRRRRLRRVEKIRLDLRPRGFLRYRVRRLLYDVREQGVGLWTVSHSWNLSRYPVVLLDQVTSAPHDVYILDEWLVHRTIDESLRRHAGDVSYSRAFAMPRIPSHSIAYVCMQVDPVVACGRVLSQEPGFRTFAANRDARLIEESLTAWSDHLKVLERDAKQRGLPWINVDATAPLETNVRLLRERLTLS